MLKTNIIQNDYTKYGDNYQLKLPLEIDYIIPKNDSVRLLSHIIEHKMHHLKKIMKKLKKRNKKE